VLANSDKRNIPVYGFIFSHAVVSVDANNFYNRVGSVRLLKSLIQKGISIMVFPEGTFNFLATPLEKFHDGAFWLAIETQTPVRPFLMPDAYRRMPFGNFFSMSPGLNRIVYLDEVPVAGYTLSDIARLKDEVYSIMEKKLIAYDAAWRKIEPS
jgi:1-acyl-sn-glycerol-3-phosphate acyltransferase